MKKIYQKPDMQVIELKSKIQIICASGQVEGTSRSVKMGWDDDADEGEGM